MNKKKIAATKIATLVPMSTSENAVDVTFETSDYTTMKDRHASGVVHKLVFHANGNLCGDWDPGTRVLLRTADDEARPAPARAGLPTRSPRALAVA